MKKLAHWPLSAASAVTSLVNVFLPLLLVRLLSVDAVGRYKVFFLYLVVLPNMLGTAALQNGVSFWSGRAATARATLSQAWWAQLTLGSACVALGLIFREPLRAWLGWSAGETLAFLAAAGATLVSGFYEELCIADGRVARGAVFSSVFELLRTATLLATAVITGRLAPIFWAHAIVMATKASCGILLGARAGWLRAGITGAPWRPIVNYALPVFGGTFLLMLVTYSDQLILSRYLIPADFAIYTVGCLWIPPLMLYEQSVNRVLIPRLARTFSEGELTEAQALYRQAVEELAWVLAPAAVGLAVFAEPILTLLFTERFAPSAAYLHWYAFSYLLLAIPYDVVPRAQGRSGWILAASSLSAVSSVGLGLLLTMRYGAYGALSAMLFSDLLLKGLGLWFLRARLGWRWGQVLPLASLGKLAIYCLAAAVAAHLTRPLFPSDRLWFLAGGSAIFASFVGLGARQIGISINFLRVRASV